SGTSEMGFGEPPSPEDFVLMGDFNMLPGSDEYVDLVGRTDFWAGVPLVVSRPVDAAPRVSTEPATTWVEPKEPQDQRHWKRIDYVFTSAGLTKHVRSSRVDAEAVGSDHLPLWVEID